MILFSRATVTAFVISTVALPAMADHPALSLGTGQAAPIATESGKTLPDGRWAAALRTEAVKFDGYSDSALQQLRQADGEADIHSVKTLLSTSLGIAHGVTENFMVGVWLPFIHRDAIREPAHTHTGGLPEIEKLGDATGAGDTTLIGQYRFFQRNNSHWSALFGLKMPTGETNLRADNGERLETELQPGSGSWDGILGVAASRGFGDISLDASALYSFVTEGARETDLGDVLSYNGALSYRVPSVGRTGRAASNYALDTVLELNGEWRDEEETGRRNNDNSGGHLLYLSAGARLALDHHVNLALSFGIPVVRNLNGDQIEPDYRVISSIGVNF